MREEMIEALIKFYKAKIETHRLNVEVLFERTVGVAEHPDIMETIDKELVKMSEWDDRLVVLENYFGD
tara:strand:+ start:6180 stop:6383 length:204 start_codon:yes stop_codon:yes gene_type:complete